MNELLEKIENFLKSSGMSPTMLGIKAVNNSRIIFDLRKGAGCTLSTMDKILNFIKNYEGKAE